MIDSHAQHDDALQAFHTWRLSTEAQLPGYGGADVAKICQFIPQSNLQRYFERPRQVENLLDAVLNSQQRPEVDANYVRKYYLRSFATLLCIGEGHLIHHFQQHKSLRDQKLPYRAKPEDFPFTTPDKFEEFKDAQWQFCASNLEYGMTDRFKEEDILPIIHKEKIGEGGSAIIYKIVVDETYNSLRPRPHVIPDRSRHHKNTFVMKTYRAAEAEENYRAERGAYMKLRWQGNPSPHIIDYYGGFIHGNSYNLILEYADRGTLESFMRDTAPPSTIEDTLLFWDRLSNVTHGIMTIHGKIGNDSSASQILNGWHQDVKPANILVFGTNGNSPYDCHFKIADLGLTHFKPSASQSNEPSDLDAFGTRAYGAPETFRSLVDIESSPLQVTPAVDIWSVGCVFSEVSVWAHYGWKKVVEYRRQRSEEIERRGGGEGEYIFHYDAKLLDAVNNIHRDMNGKQLASNHLTRSVLDRLVNEMLQHGTRPHAKWVFEKSKRLIKEVEDRFEVSVAGLVGNTNGELINSNEARNGTRSPPQVPPEHSRGPPESFVGRSYHSQAEEAMPRGGPLQPYADLAPLASPSESYPHRHYQNARTQSSERRSITATEIGQSNGQGSHIVSDPRPPPSIAAHTYENFREQHVEQHQEEPVRPTLTIAEGHHWKKKRKNGEQADLRGGENVTYLDQRDHIFLIDNSETMRHHRRDIESVVSLLAYILKTSDNDGLDIHFTQTSTMVNSRKSSKILSSISQVSFGGISDMRGKLYNVLREHIDKFGTPISPTRSFIRHRPPQQPQRPLSLYILTDAKWQPTDVGGYIKDHLVHSMIAKSCPKEHVAIQFIRFGNDQASIKRLDELDHGLGLKQIGMDIIDHTYWNDNVWKLLLGAVNGWYDDDPI